MEQQLYPHNKIAYDKVMTAFETSQRTCICHPTGTGKSYVVAAVCQHFDKVLVLAPNIFVLNQQKTVLKWHSSVTYMTYPWLMLNYENIQHQYDLIVLDEFHRAGASEWGAAVELLLESQPQAKILGTSATPIRYLDNERDMAQELFNNNVASTLTIAEAWSQNILPIPIYVTGFFSFDKIVEDATQKIRRFTRIKEGDKKDRILRLSNTKLEWEKSNGMVDILQRHLSRYTQRMLVFCAHIDKMHETQLSVKRWLRKAGFTVSKTYTLHSNQSDNEQSEQMRLFSSDDSKGIKILFAINILNEGVHIPNIDAVLMLRTTASKIVYLQQLGRCLTAASGDKPLVLDMVDNITTTSAVSGMANEFRTLEKERSKRGDYTPRNFDIFDYTLGIRQVIDKLTGAHDFFSLEERLNILRTFCEQHQRLPKWGLKGDAEYKHYTWFLSHAKDNEEFQQLYNKYGKMHISSHLPIAERINAYIRIFEDFYKENGRMPTTKDEGIGTRFQIFKNKYYNSQTEYYNHLAIKKFFSKYGITRKETLSVDERIKAVRDYCEKNGERPTNNKGLEIYNHLLYLKTKHSHLPEVQKLLLDYPSRKDGDSYTHASVMKIMNFYDENKRLPSRKDGSIRDLFKRVKYRYPQHPDVIKLKELEAQLKTKKK